MTNPLHFSIVATQVVAFQLLWPRFSRRLPDLIVGQREMPAEMAAKLDRFRAHAGRGRMILGVLGLLAAVLAAVVIPITPGQRKITLAMISLLSSGTLVAGFFFDVIKIRRTTASLPDPTVRVAGLRPRSLSMAYPLALEAIPIALIAATVAGTIWALHAGVALSGFRPWIRPSVQLFYYLFTLVMAIFQVRTGSCLTWRARNLQPTPEETLALSEKIMRLEVRYLYYCRLAMVVFFGIMQLRVIRTAMGLAGADLLRALEWIVLMSVLGQLILYLQRHPIRSARQTMPLGEIQTPKGGAR